MRGGEPRNPPPDQSADHRDGRSRFGVPGTKADRESQSQVLACARLRPPPAGVRARPRRPVRAQAARPAGRMQPRGVSHAGR